MRVEYISSIPQLKNDAKILFDLLGKAKDRISLKIAREANLTLAAREAHGEPQKQWRFLKIAEEKTAKVSESMIVARIYNEARTFFQNSV